jgi:hypothetical protein
MRTKKLAGLLVILGMFSAQAHAETRRGKIWKVSAAVLGAVTIADIQSSAGRREANGFLQSNDGRFNARGVTLKSLVVAGAVGGQWLMLRRNPNPAGYAAGINFAMSAVTGAAVVHNHMVK